MPHLVNSFDSWSQLREVVLGENQDLHIGYFPGAGGHRLRRLILGHIWKTQPINHYHNADGVEELLGAVRGAQMSNALVYRS